MTVLGWLHATKSLSAGAPLLDLFIGIPLAISYYLPYDALKCSYNNMFAVFISALTIFNMIIFVPTLLFHRFKDPHRFIVVQGTVFIVYMIISAPISGLFVYL